VSLTKLLTPLRRFSGALPWSNKVLCIALAPEQITLAVRSGKRVLPDTAVTIPLQHPEAHWQGAVAALRAWLLHPGHAASGLPMAVSLSNRWCQLMMLPWSDALLTQDEGQRFAQAQFAATFGDAAHGWRITWDDAGYGQMRLACAIESDFQDALEALARECGHTLIAVESALSIAGRAVGTHRPAALALQERGRVVLAQLEKGRIVGVQAQPCRGNWSGELLQAWQRWTLRSPELGHIKSVALVRLDDTPAHGPLGEMFDAVRLPSYTLAPGFAAVCMMEP
jgi:hypothetical protein